MERHKCKLCLKSFSNGRALGGHMRSHMLNLPLVQKQEEEEEEENNDDDHHQPIQLSENTDSASSSSSSSDEEEEAEAEGVYYGLRENPKRSVRLVDPEFSFAVEAASVILQDRESETESSKNPTRRRSKRTRKLLDHHQYHLHHHQEQEQEQEQEVERQEQETNNNIKKVKLSDIKTNESWVEPEPVSSISDTTTEEDVAFCLMMLSRDKWKRKEKQSHHQKQEKLGDNQQEEAERSIEETDESDEFKSCKTRSRGKYRCDTCKKVFKSYQALGGHRASHKKLKHSTPIQETELETGKNSNNNNNNAVTSSSVAVKKIHECPYCFRVFSSGQALGGHKRSHVLTGISTATTPTPPTTTSTPIKIEDNLNLLDLNLPAPVDEDDLSQVELSAVSDAEFVNHIKW